MVKILRSTCQIVTYDLSFYDHGLYHKAGNMFISVYKKLKGGLVSEAEEQLQIADRAKSGFLLLHNMKT